MTRIAWILTTLGAVLIGALWFLLLYSPTAEEIEDVRASTDQAVSEATTLRQEAAQLRLVRENAPEAEAQIATGRALLPDESSMPALLRQLQAAADESGVKLVSVSPSAPAPVESEAGGPELVSIAVQLSVEGSYFQLIDMARRVEDPSITARGVKWRNVAIQPIDDDSYPLLSAAMSGEVFARSGFAVAALAEDAEAAATEGAADGDVADADGEPTEGADAPQPSEGGLVQEGELQ